MFSVLLAVKVVSRLFYRLDSRWVGEVPADPWHGVRLIALLNHTSLYEPLFVAAAPNRILWMMASRAVAPGADTTINRPLVGRFYKLVLHDVIPISRERDETWDAVLRRIDDDTVVIIAPEGRMKRANGLDKHGKPMSVRGGIADILRAIPSGRFILAYSGGLHHVQVPGQALPKIFKTLRLRLETVDIAVYRNQRLAEGGVEGFKAAVIADLERRRDEHCTAASHQPAPSPSS